MTSADERFTLELPPDPAFVATARLFASSLARHFEMDENVVEDLKLAISEACGRALAGTNGDRKISLSVAHANERLVFEIAQSDLRPVKEQDTPTPSQEEMASGLSLELISALFDDAAVVTGAQGAPVVRFSIP